MTGNKVHLAVAPFVAALVIVLAGCGAETSPASAGSSVAAPAPTPSNSPLPPRPAELRLNAVDPCALLTTAQQGQLGVKAALSGNDGDELGSAACLWGNNGGKPDNRWVARLIVKRSADYALGSTTGVQVVQVDGFSAVQTAAPYQDPNTNCVLVVDVAQGQSLGVQYLNLAGDYPGISHDMACQLDRKAAELMVRNLRALAR
ncbi:MAG TPA: DUF3558 domain-containing protein [Pseudonocardia sp.]|uniref:DUF3558 domain-containing protein n=1 Tax=Pseudonocardia sp. TaxID=60912 RepID=UPI002C688EF9|nr:DUF3558 domain-containing protein [Pseudonocardia sp.]HTF46915.1 DUF3558 domain-containing protein [Pseudonocardia sp.]